jgi:hypothetical protein
LNQNSSLWTMHTVLLRFRICRFQVPRISDFSCVMLEHHRCVLFDMSSQKFESELLLPFCGSSNEKFVMLLLERSNCMRLGISLAMPLSTSVMWLLERLRHFRFVRLV